MGRGIFFFKNTGRRAIWVENRCSSLDHSLREWKSEIYLNQGILSVPGIAGYEWVPARIGRFYKDKIFFFIIPTANKNMKNMYLFLSRHFPCSVFPDSTKLLLGNNYWFFCVNLSFYFNFRQSKEKHMMAVHGGNKPFACTQCDKTFSEHTSLKTHIDRYVNEYWFTVIRKFLSLFFILITCIKFSYLLRYDLSCSVRRMLRCGIFNCF